MTTIVVILFFVSAYGVLRISSQIFDSFGHLSDEDILEYKYRRRSLSETYQRKITNHIGTCEECRKRFTDTLME